MIEKKKFKEPEKLYKFSKTEIKTSTLTKRKIKKTLGLNKMNS